MSIFLRGMLTLAPIAITLYILYKIYQMMDGVFKGLLISAGFYFPGAGALSTLLLIFGVGLIASNLITSHFLRLVDALFIKVPGIKTIYGIIKDTITSFSGEKNSFSHLALIELPNSPVKLIGFITNEKHSVFIPEGYVAVYLMQSMQFAGNLILVKKQYVTELDTTSEEAIKFISSAGII